MLECWSVGVLEFWSLTLLHFILLHFYTPTLCILFVSYYLFVLMSVCIRMLGFKDHKSDVVFTNPERSRRVKSIPKTTNRQTFSLKEVVISEHFARVEG